MRRRSAGERLFIGVAVTLAACKAQPEPKREEARAPVVVHEGGSEKPEKLIFGLAPFLAEADMRKEHTALGEHLAAATGLPVEIELAESYRALGEAMRHFDVHVAILPPLAYVRAKRDNPQLVLLAAEIVDGASTYAGYIITRDDSGIDAVEELIGKRFAFVDPSSTSGYLYPLAYLRSFGLEPETFFGKVTFAGDHTKLIEMVLGREVDAGATFATAYKMAALEAPEGKRLRILAKTGRIPLDAVCVNPRLDGGLIDKLRTALLGLSTRTEEGRRVLRGLTAINGFSRVGDDHYDEVRRIEALMGDE